MLTAPWLQETSTVRCVEHTCPRCSSIAAVQPWQQQHPWTAVMRRGQGLQHSQGMRQASCTSLVFAVRKYGFRTDKALTMAPST
jgi:hypothetical protein